MDTSFTRKASLIKAFTRYSVHLFEGDAKMGSTESCVLPFHLSLFLWVCVRVQARRWRYFMQAKINKYTKFLNEAQHKLLRGNEKKDYIISSESKHEQRKSMLPAEGMQIVL